MSGNAQPPDLWSKRPHHPQGVHTDREECAADQSKRLPVQPYGGLPVLPSG
jgi:hypothetical protein